MTDDRWQPIETAPKDGTLLLACNDRPHFQNVAVIYWDIGAPELEIEGRWRTSFHEVVGDLFTHWRPIPAPPQEIER